MLHIMREPQGGRVEINITAFEQLPLSHPSPEWVSQRNLSLACVATPCHGQSLVSQAAPSCSSVRTANIAVVAC
jgi:hypothetical protein